MSDSKLENVDSYTDCNDEECVHLLLHDTSSSSSSLDNNNNNNNNNNDKSQNHFVLGRFLVLFIILSLFAITFVWHQSKYSHHTTTTSREDHHQHEDAGQPLLLSQPDTTHSNTTTTTTTNLTTNLTTLPKLSIVVQLSGEMGNHISKLASGIALALEWQQTVAGANKKQPVLSQQANLLLRHQDHPKYETAATNFQACFPNVAHLNVSAANTREFDQLLQQQQHWRMNQTTMADFLDKGINTGSLSTIRETLLWVVQHFETLQQQQQQQTELSFPFLYSNYFTAQDDIMDHYYNAFRRYFTYDYNNPVCCQAVPFQNETVFHFRNFVHEMPRKGIQKGYEELKPRAVALQLLKHLPKGARVAIVTRFSTSEKVDSYVTALTQRGFQVRVITNQTALQDFCFLLQATHQIVGLARSTFFYWAAILGKASRVIAYSVDSPDKRASHTPLWDTYNWTNAELQKRIQFVLYPQDENE